MGYLLSTTIHMLVASNDDFGLNILLRRVFEEKLIKLRPRPALKLLMSLGSYYLT